LLPFVLWVLAVTLAIAAVVAWIRLRKISAEMAGSETARFLEEPASDEIAPVAESASTEEVEGSSVRPEALEQGAHPALTSAELRVGEADLAPAIKGLDRTIGEEARRTSKGPADASASIFEGTRIRFHNEPSAARAAFGASAAVLSDPHLPTLSDDSQSAVIELAHQRLGGFQTKASQHQPELRVRAAKVVTPPSGDGGVPVLEHLQENWRVAARSRKPEPAAGAATEQLPAIDQAQAVEAKFGERGQRLQSSDKLLKSEATQPKKQAEETAQRLTGKPRTSEMEFIEHAEMRLAGLTQTSLESLSQEAKAIASECGHEFRQHLDRLVVLNSRPVEGKPGGIPEQKWLGARNDADARWTGIDKARRQFVRASPRHRASAMPAGLNVAVWLVAMITTLVLIFIVLSVNPIRQLLPDPPAEFFGQRPDWTARRRVTEERLARAYWEWAVRNLQAKYRFGVELPADPPVGFQVEGAAGAPSLNGDSEARIRYWGRLRRVWTLPQAWRKSYVWSTKWIDLIFRPGGRDTRQ
jgi:hypothetical protein